MNEFLKTPGFIVSTGTIGADISYLLAVVFTTLFLIAWGMAKKGYGTRHHKLILISMVSMVLYFVGYYYARSLGALAFEGKEGFGGPVETYEGVFLPVLNTHLILVLFGFILTFYMIWEGFRASNKENGEWALKSGPMKVSPQKFRRLVLGILGIGAANHLLQWVARDQFPWQAQMAYGLIFLTFVLIVSIEKLIEKLLPDGATRHRILGRITMVVFALILCTSTATYLMLYVFYPANPAGS
ncbi:MAG: DUF420 domain-containing protein [Candidatus Nitronauta litoralis]|uniref:DUF420 domain-containing protein n=1 Tax=Candidatus Nitronauta litoralis TaxID=2705533 RepID=A0A7T0BTB6_9BACT|nr:MAG: DUF420 domain-containing protein [Candidatus Nitronauta litoralis]